MTAARAWGYQMETEATGAARSWWAVSRADRAVMVAHHRLENLTTALSQHDASEEAKRKAKKGGR